ncbi:DUF5988 family protein [Kineosporia rhizophila]|nr:MULTISPECIES: DUF5988 family protein [Kineosporia]
MKALLTGGPETAMGSGIVEVQNLAETVKIAFAAGYEHFRHHGEVRHVDGQEMPVFAWCGRTRIAE